MQKVLSAFFFAVLCLGMMSCRSETVINSQPNFIAQNSPVPVATQTPVIIEESNTTVPSQPAPSPQLNAVKTQPAAPRTQSNVVARPTISNPTVKAKTLTVMAPKNVDPQIADIVVDYTKDGKVGRYEFWATDSQHNAVGEQLIAVDYDLDGSVDWIVYKNWVVPNTEYNTKLWRGPAVKEDLQNTYELDELSLAAPKVISPKQYGYVQLTDGKVVLTPLSKQDLFVSDLFFNCDNMLTQLNKVASVKFPNRPPEENETLSDVDNITQKIGQQINQILKNRQNFALYEMKDFANGGVD